MPALWISLGVTLTAFALVWAVHLRLKDAGIVDYYWGPGFVVIAAIGVAIGGSPGPAGWILIAAVTLWALRLTAYLVRRHMVSSEEDPRYRAMRERGGAAFWWRSLFTVFLLQGFIQWLIASPLHAAFDFGPAGTPPSPVFWIGLAVFAAGFIIESVADAQLAAFRSDPANRGRLMTSGMWAWSRHPNYFGEATAWWGIGLMGFGLSGSVLAFVGPALLTFLLLKVSGVTMLDRHLSATKPGFAEYRARTSGFVPLPPKRADYATLREGAE